MYNKGKAGTGATVGRKFEQWSFAPRICVAFRSYFCECCMSLYFTLLCLQYAFPQALDTLFVKGRLSYDVDFSISKQGQVQVSWNGWPPHVRTKLKLKVQIPQEKTILGQTKVWEREKWLDQQNAGWASIKTVQIRK